MAKALTLTFSLLGFCFATLLAGPTTTTDRIHVDQFGYLPGARKVAIISDPQVGYNAAVAFTPSTGTNQYQVRRWSDDAVIFSGTVTQWNGGNTHSQSGDRAWWFDFTALTTPGDYYVYDVGNAVGSYRFTINSNVYWQPLYHSLRTFFYQRCNYAKTVPYAATGWTDAAAFEGANQDRAARSVSAQGNPATAKDMHGGWFDAGDYNKYVTFASGVVSDLLDVYTTLPNQLGDNTLNIPESGNGIPDILDEIIWELQWMERMQDTDGGVFIKIGMANNGSSTAPPSATTTPRYYEKKCTSSTIALAFTFAKAAWVLKNTGIPSLVAYGNTLQAKAIQAWNYVGTSPTYQTNCDPPTNPRVQSGDADRNENSQRAEQVAAAVYLWKLTGNATYKNFVDVQYVNLPNYSGYWFGPYDMVATDAMLVYCSTPGANATVCSNYNTRLINSANSQPFYRTGYQSANDPYRAHMPDAQYDWGSNSVRSRIGNLNYNLVSFGLDPANETTYKEIAAEHIHWIHGANPMSFAYLTNMNSFGAENSVSTIYHTWFHDGDVLWDEAGVSTYGPAPGFLPGGPNRNYQWNCCCTRSCPWNPGADCGSTANNARCTSVSLEPPNNQPPMKAYKQFNDSWPLDSWQVTEPAIYYQAAYTKLLARIISEEPLPVELASYTVAAQGDGALLAWTTAQEENNAYFLIERSTDGATYDSLATVSGSGTTNSPSAYTYVDADLPDGKVVYYRLSQVDLDGTKVSLGVRSLTQGPQSLALSLQPNPTTGTLMVSLGETPTSDTHLEILDMQGRLVHSQTTLEAQTQLSLNVPSGLYVVRVTSAEGTAVQRLTISR